MSNDFQGTASVITASRHLGAPSDERLNDAVDILMSSSGKPTIARVDFKTPLDWPGNPNFVAVNLPDGSCISGLIVDIERPINAPGWVTFTVDD